MTDNVQERLQAHFGLFGNDAEQESHQAHIRALGQDWQPTAEESAELPDYEGGQIVLDNISRFLADRAKYVESCSYKLTGLLQQLDAEAQMDQVVSDSLPLPIAAPANAIDVQDLPIAGVVLVGDPDSNVSEPKPRSDGERRDGKDKGRDQQGKRQDRRQDQSRVDSFVYAPELSFPAKAETKKPTVLPVAIVQLLQSPSWHAEREAVQRVFILCRDEDSTKQAIGRTQLAAWKKRTVSYVNGNAGFDKCNFGRHLMSCINDLELGVDINSLKYQYHYVTGFKPPDESVP